MNPAERQPLPGWESRVPRAPDEFARQWRESLERMVLMREIEEYESCYPVEGGERLGAFRKRLSIYMSPSPFPFWKC